MFDRMKRPRRGKGTGDGSGGEEPEAVDYAQAERDKPSFGRRAVPVEGSAEPIDPKPKRAKKRDDDEFFTSEPIEETPATNWRKAAPVAPGEEVKLVKVYKKAEVNAPGRHKQPALEVPPDKSKLTFKREKRFYFAGETADLGMDAGHDGDAQDPDREPEGLRAPEPLVRQEAKDQERVEDRHRRLDDRGEARVDVLLAPGDQPERQGRVEDAEHEAVPPRIAELPNRALAAEAPRDVAEQHGGGEQRADGHHRRRLDLVDRDLDEQVRGAPDGGQRQQHRPVAVHRARLAASARRARRLLPAVPVPSATPASTSARPSREIAVTDSSRKIAP